MKTIKYTGKIFFFILTVYAAGAWAITPEEEKKICKKPKFREFSPAAYSEVLPESEISFHVSRGADPLSITAEAKTLNMPVDVRNRVNFFQVSAQLPSALREGFARIHLTAKAAEGGCLGQDGWLIKIKSAKSAAGTTEPDETRKLKQVDRSQP